MGTGGGWAEQRVDDHDPTSVTPIAPPPPPPSNPAPVLAPDGASAPAGPPPRPVPAASRPVSAPVAPSAIPRSASRAIGKGPLALGGAVLLIAAAAGGWMLTRPDDAAPVAANTTADAPADSPAASVEPPVPVPESSESVPVETSETTAAPEPTVAHFEDLVGDSSLSNKGALMSSSADVRAVHVHGPAQGTPGWVVVKLSNADPGVGVILRIDTDNDRWPDLTAWQHTATGALGSFQVVDWSHGNDILQRSSETDEHFVATGHQAPQTGVAFPLVFRPGEIAGDRLRFNVQTVNDDLYYDYFPSRQRWTATAYVVAP